MGYGNNEAQYASTLARNQLPSLQTLPIGTLEEHRKLIWMRCRIVAFDVPEPSGPYVHVAASD